MRCPKYQVSVRRAFTLIELLVVISIISLLASVLMSILPLVRAQAAGVACRSNLHQLGIAMYGYANSWDDYLVSPWDQASSSELRSWHLRIATDMGATAARSFQCPGNRQHRPSATIPAVPAPMDGATVLVQWHADYALPVANWAAWWNNYDKPAAWISDWSPWTGNGSEIFGRMAPDTAIVVESADRADLFNYTQYGGGINALADWSGRLVGQHRGKDGILCADGHVQMMTPLETRGSGSTWGHRGVWSITAGD